MNRDRIRKITLVGLLVLALAAFAYFAVIRRQPRHEMAMGQAEAQKDVYYCPRHKTYHSDKPGNCPICSMKLVKLEVPGAPQAGGKMTTADMTKTEPSPSGAAAPPAPGATPQDNAIFVAPEKQQLIGMRSVPAE